MEEKSHEITAIPELFTMVDMAGAIVTMEAMGCQQERAKVMTEQEAADVLALKENHPTRSEDVMQLCDAA